MCVKAHSRGAGGDFQSLFSLPPSCVPSEFPFPLQFLICTGFGMVATVPKAGGTATPMSIVGQCPCMAEVRGDRVISTARVKGDSDNCYRQ